MKMQLNTAGNNIKVLKVNRASEGADYLLV